MPNLSTPIGDLRARYDVVVIGSGYGGAVVARWMAKEAHERHVWGQQPFSVCLLERGLEIRPGQYPTTLTGALRAAQIDTQYGRLGRRTSLFDVRTNPELTVLVGCGLGGTSLINASVILEPKDLSGPVWPEALRPPGALAREFALVKEALGAEPVPPDLELEKVSRLIESAGRQNRKLEQHRPPIAVSFHTHINQFGVQQGRCTLCGNCITGCNYSAKSTLIMNYLPAAVTAGASIFCGMLVSAVQPPEHADGDWLVHTRILDRGATVFGNPEIPIRAGMVFLASGSLGSTELLLRSRDRYHLSLSPVLGQHFSGNGDVIAFGYNIDKRVNGMGYGSRLPREPVVGPTIAGMLDERKNPDVKAMIQEAAVPGALGPLLRFIGPLIARLSRLGNATGVRFSVKGLWREIDSLLRGSHHGSLVRTQTFLAMSFDDGRGSMKLADDRLRIDWNHAGSQLVFARIASRLNKLTGRLKGAYVTNPIWSRLFGRRLLIAHPLGGCVMADLPRDGVVNPLGQVFRCDAGNCEGEQEPEPVHRGLYVCDGAVIPTPLGTNPSLTIAALAQRIAEQAVLEIPKAPAVPPTTGEERPTARRTDPGIVGLRYAERLRGSMRLNGSDASVELFLHMSIEDLEQQQNSPAQRVEVIGVAGMPDLRHATRRFTISKGTLNVLVDDDRQVDTKLLVYRLKLTPTDNTNPTSADEGTLWLCGHKTVNFDACRRSVWKAATRLPFVIYRSRPHQWSATAFHNGRDIVDLAKNEADRAQFLDSAAARDADVIGVGLVGSNLADTIRLSASLKVIHEPRFLRRIAVAFRFQWLFVDALVQARVWGLRRTDRLDPLDRDARGRPPSDEGTVVRDDRDLDQERYLLTRFEGRRSQGDPKRAVVLIPGFSMSTYWFRARTPRTNFTEFLRDNGYDVWLLDYRASDRLSASRRQFTLDDLATSDFPEAIERVYQEEKRPVQVVAHCVGSISLLMSLLSGSLKPGRIQSIVLSQSMAFIHQPFVNRLKARLHLAEVLRFLGFRPVMTPDFDLRSSVGARLLDRLLYFYPSRERCRSGVCRRLLLIYGEANRHAKLDRVTHEMLYDMVDRGNLTTLAQLQRMAVQKKIVDANGQNIYVHPENFKNIVVPMTLLQGERNNLFRPAGARETLRWLRQYRRL